MSERFDPTKYRCTVVVAGKTCGNMASYRVFWNEGKKQHSALMCDQHAYDKSRQTHGAASLFALND